MSHSETEVTGADILAELYAPHGADDPIPTYREVLARCPVTRATNSYGNPAIAVSDYDDITWAFRHPEVFSSSGDALDLGAEQLLIPHQVDPPMHTTYRRLLNPWFLPRSLAPMEPDVRRLVNELIDGFAGKGECDFHEEFASLLPSTIFLRFLGLPLSDLPQFFQWRDDTIRPDVEPGDYEGAQRIRKAAGKAVNTYFVDAIAQRRAHPADDLMTEIVHGRVDDRDLTDTELLGIFHLLMLGGLDTVTASLDCMIAYLATHPDRRARIIDDPAVIPDAVEELLRQQTPVMTMPRVVAQAHEMGGIRLESGESVMLVLGAANMDPAQFDDPETVDFDRTPNKHVAFGGGHHLCLGAHLARLEMRVALEEIHRRIPDYAIPPGTELHYSPSIRQAETLPLVFTRSPGT
ncbi:MAG: cytochrome superfamily protein [Actinomycetia bacterium]|nr:cytochrome superfamily protein [Actinomycetes bacterium]